MSSSGTLFDLDKLNDVSKDVLVKKSSEELYQFLLQWSEEFRPELHAIYSANPEKMLAILNMDRTGDKPRKDLVFAGQIAEFISYFFDETYKVQDGFPAEVPAEDIPVILKSYLEGYDPSDDNSQWFGKIRALGEELGYAAKPKDFKKNPDQYKGHVGHVSTVIRVALMGRQNSPDLWTIQQIMGEEMTRARIEGALQNL